MCFDLVPAPPGNLLPTSGGKDFHCNLYYNENFDKERFRPEMCVYTDVNIIYGKKFTRPVLL
ncbi:hypothetical protein A3860_12280 [Niastella vici]|uniref:Uncharacterized protein n=1 Tax=Niastella vici TaxID=1703345 RepID=A0A1V9G6K3_9BACT|nr:hypothetical protein A3860_12280 [Niastella vici]